MTPLAQRLMREELEGKRGAWPAASLLTPAEFAHVRCFDCTAVSEMAYALADDMCARDVITRQVAFLPAPLTWIEWFLSGATNRRVAFLLQSVEDGPRMAAVYQAMTITPAEKALRFPGVPHRPDMVGKVNLVLFGLIGLGDSAQAAGLMVPDDMRDSIPDPNVGHVQLLYALLAIINTPRLIGQTQHAPHVGLQRQLRNSKDFAGAQLLQWTQVKLCVLDHPERGAAGDPGGVLTGRRALHFVRSFIRIRLGKLELVKAHQRGNAELGERRPVYVVQP